MKIENSKSKIRRILVTGCAGFIGCKVTEFLLKDGYHVIGVDNMNNAYDVRLKKWRLDQIRKSPNFNFFRIDICDRDGLRQLFQSGRQKLGAQKQELKFDAVINLSARAGVRQSVENPWIYYNTNVTGTLNLLELCREYIVEKFVLASSSSIYGNCNPMPFREDQDTDHPLSPYASSKKSAEELCYTFHYLYNLDVTVLRYFTVYGPAGRPDMSLFRFVQWISEGKPVTIYGDGNQSRDFTYIDDIARGTIASLKLLGNEVINLGSETPIVLSDAIRLIEELLGKKANLVFKPRHPADVPSTCADIGKAERLLDWRPQFVFKEGVRLLVEWYQKNRPWAKEIQA